MPPLFPDDNRSRIRAIRVEAGGDDAEALARLFEDPAIRDDGTLPGRLRAILAATERAAIPGLHTGLPFGDAGFAGDRQPGGEGFRDPWAASRNQVGHFLTAVGLAFRPEKIAEPVLGVPLRVWLGADCGLSDERVARRLTIGHEMAPDPGGYAALALGALAGAFPAPLVGARGPVAALGVAVGAAVGAAGLWAAEQLLCFRRQLGRATVEDEGAFDRALAAVTTGPGPDGPEVEAALAPLFDRVNVRSRGNSKQDLRLSLLGWALGVFVRRGELTRGADVAAWLRGRLKPP